MGKDSVHSPFNNPKKKLFFIFLPLLIGAFLFFGGLGVELFYVKLYGVFFALLLVGLVLTLKEKLLLPKEFRLYFLFLLVFGLNVFWSQYRFATLEQLFLFTSGGLFWIALYNIYREFGQWLDKIVIVLGLLFGGLFILNRYWGDTQTRPWSLFLPFSGYLNHNNIGDFWAPVLIIVVYSIVIRPKKYIYWFLAVSGVYFLLESQSRSAYVAFAIGVYYLLKETRFVINYHKILYIFVFIGISLFLFTGSYKTVIFSRPYFVQALVGLAHNPFGVGVGNFGLISTDVNNWIFGLSGPSVAVHNIVLETFSGMGIMGTVFIVWLIKTSMNLWKKKGRLGLVYRASFFTLLTNFIFLGISQKLSLNEVKKAPPLLL